MFMFSDAGKLPRRKHTIYKAALFNVYSKIAANKSKMLPIWLLKQLRYIRCANVKSVKR
jgi:hypothetical protein